MTRHAERLDLGDDVGKRPDIDGAPAALQKIGEAAFDGQGGPTDDDSVSQISHW